MWSQLELWILFIRSLRSKRWTKAKTETATAAAAAATAAQHSAAVIRTMRRCFTRVHIEFKIEIEARLRFDSACWYFFSSVSVVNKPKTKECRNSGQKSNQKNKKKIVCASARVYAMLFSISHKTLSQFIVSSFNFNCSIHQSSNYNYNSIPFSLNTFSVSLLLMPPLEFVVILVVVFIIGKLFFFHSSTPFLFALLQCATKNVLVHGHVMFKWHASECARALTALNLAVLLLRTCTKCVCVYLPNESAKKKTLEHREWSARSRTACEYSVTIHFTQSHNAT